MEQLGISLYLGSGKQTNQEVLRKAKQAQMKYAFTSLHIPEETISDYASETRQLLLACKEAGLSLIIDVGPRTIEKLGLTSLQELKQFNITHIRIDYGFTMDEIIALSKDFMIVLNASTLTREELSLMLAAKIDMSKISACHNFYPKPFTALSIEQVRETNALLHQYQIECIGFVSGDCLRRGPLEEGLPTVEEHRFMDVLQQVLELKYLTNCDMILVGDIDISEASWRKLEQLQENYVVLKTSIQPGYEFITDRIHHDRVDSSSHVLRSVESRSYDRDIVPQQSSPRLVGSVSVSNSLYLRYQGELEIARVDLPQEERVNIVGQVNEEFMKYLPYIHRGMGFQLEEEEHE